MSTVVSASYGNTHSLLASEMGFPEGKGVPFKFTARCYEDGLPRVFEFQKWQSLSGFRVAVYSSGDETMLITEDRA
jgi:hypothetical protein